MSVSNGTRLCGIGQTIDGRPIEIYDNGFGQSRFWVKVDGIALFQRGRMRLRTFISIAAAHRAAEAEPKP